ncbi:MAG: MBL fold metallo-hydrolase [Candidatus Pacebacteria bacterium]|nr:MBL fold metallo-hydrolase [Candidatus Paceibacterota bacterium]
MKHLYRYRPYIALGVLAAITLAIWIAVFAEQRTGVLTVAVMDVGQGDSIYIQSPTGIEVLVDGGPDSSVLRELPTLMQPFDRSLDVVIETHPDADHIAGLVDIFMRYNVGAFIEPGVPKETATFSTLIEEVEEKDTPHLLAHRGMKLELGGGATLDVLYPDHDVSTLSPSKANDGGIVMRLTYGKASMLLTGDISSKVEARLIKLDGSELDIDLLKVGHHGSRTSTSDAFVKAMTPAAAIISVGKSNRYGHPTEDVLKTLSNNNIKTFRTDQEGTVVFTSNGGEFVRAQ